ncbi:hypothetical protein EDC04DRAFT_2908542 [Pisolithus marmoratus]|nr:hypothetical protein EDC04DRAFT_2908542 [Pisolithus marmoratus]
MVNPCDISELSSLDPEFFPTDHLHLSEPSSPPSVDIPRAFELDESFAPPPGRQNLSPLTDLSSSSSSMDSTLATEQLLFPSSSFVAPQSNILLPVQAPASQLFRNLPINQPPPLSSVPVTMSNATNHCEMLLRGSNKAPKFSGKTEDICTYFKDVNQVCTDAGITLEKAKIKWAICYTDCNKSELWSSLDSTMGDDWEAFTKEYTKADLEMLLHHQVQKSMSTLEDLGKYVWEFRCGTLLPGKSYESESIRKYVRGMHVTVPELPEAIEVLMAATDLAITKLQSLHREHKPQRMVPRIFMVPPSACIPSNVEGYGDRPKRARRQTERVAVSGNKGKQKTTQDDDSDDGTDDHEDDMQGGGDDSNDRVLEDLDRPCQECSREGRAASCEGEPQQGRSYSHYGGCLVIEQMRQANAPSCQLVLKSPSHQGDPAAPMRAPVPSPTVPSPELPVASQPQLFLGSMTPLLVHYPDHALMPANFSPLAGVDELQELFEGGFSVTATRLLQDEEMPVVPEEIPVVKEESPIEIVPQETPGRTSPSPSPSRGPSSSPARMMPWLHALAERIEQLEEIVETNEIEVVGMHEDLARVTARVSRFGNMVLEQHRQLREIRELQKELLI